MTNTLEDLKSYLNAVVRSNENSTDDRHIGRVESAKGALDFLSLIESTETETVEKKPESITRIVEVDHKYTYLLYVDDVGDAVCGDKVLLESRNGGQWTGTVTARYLDISSYVRHPDNKDKDVPTLMVLEVNPSK